MKIDFSSTTDGLALTPAPATSGFLSRFIGTSRADPSFAALPDAEQAIMAALAELRDYEDLNPASVRLDPHAIWMNHDAAAALSSHAAQALGLPADIHLLLQTDTHSIIGQKDFRLTYHWVDAGQRQSPRREGCLLHTAKGLRRIPLWMKRVLDIADGFSAGAPLEDHWKALAEFRQALEPDENVPGIQASGARMAMTGFLRGVKVQLADSFSISPNQDLSDFEILPFSRKTLEPDENGQISESAAELSGDLLDEFHYKLASKPDVCHAYQLGRDRYLVIDRSAKPVLAEMLRAKKAPEADRREFIRNPRVFVASSISRTLAESDQFQSLNPAEQQEQIENACAPGFIETREYSERVIGVEAYTRPDRGFEQSSTTWLPEIFTQRQRDALVATPLRGLAELQEQMEDKFETDDATVRIADETINVNSASIAEIKGLIARKQRDGDQSSSQDEHQEVKRKPLILATDDNYDEVSWTGRIRPRRAEIPFAVPVTIKTSLKSYQTKGFEWLTQAWAAGLPGVLNADEQGLGKTLQTITFLKWLQDHMKSPQVSNLGPILIVAPTSLLQVWEEQVEGHVESGAFGHLTRLYGGGIGANKKAGMKGVETKDSLPRLDLGWLHEAIEDKRAHRHWLLTTYQTLADYQHSLGKVRFAAVVFDEIQAAKNYDTARSKSVAAVNADFCIGLTGTPIENTTMDLWAILERLGTTLMSGVDFQKRFGKPDAENMAELNALVFKSQNASPPIGIRRIKDEVASDLPRKTRRLHPKEMPRTQAQEYDRARQSNGLKMLHHIRSVSVHPGGDGSGGHDTFVEFSARLQETVEILTRIQKAGERALVFIEDRKIQYRFAEILRYKFGLAKVDVINGETPIPKRKKIVEEFQTHLDRDRGFDVLVLGPKAAGTGLTLTAATHVIHLSRWWNPAVEEQCNDRIHRIGQTKPVTVHMPMAIHGELREHSFDCLLHELMQRKRKMAAQALWPMGDTQDDVAQLQRWMAESAEYPTGDAVDAAMRSMFSHLGLPPPVRETDGSIVIT